MSRWPPHAYLTEAAERHADPAVSKIALRHAQTVQRRGLPALLTLGHLAEETGVSYDFLRDVVGRKAEHYTTFRSRKRSGGWRYICIPDARLMRVQRWLNDHLLSRLSTHPASMAYAPGCSPAKCAAVHCGCRWLVKIDVRQFFDSVSEIQVYRAIYTAGYAPLISFEIARLCTRLSNSSRRSQNASLRVNRSDRYSIELYRNRRLGYLPQGAPTSPMLANLSVRKVDSEIESVSEELGTIYTRYADDMVFSAGAGFGRGNACRLIQRVYEILLCNGLRPHTAKTVVAPPGARKVVLGLLVDGETPTLSRSFRARLDTHVHCIRIVGPIKHARARRFESVLGLRNHVEGLVAYAKAIDPKFAEKNQTHLDKIEWPV